MARKYGLILEVKGSSAATALLKGNYRHYTVLPVSDNASARCICSSGVIPEPHVGENNMTFIFGNGILDGQNIWSSASCRPCMFSAAHSRFRTGSFRSNNIHQKGGSWRPCSAQRNIHPHTFHCLILFSGLILILKVISRIISSNAAQFSHRGSTACFRGLSVDVRGTSNAHQ